MRSSLRVMVLLVLGLTLSGCTTSSSPVPPSPELEISNPLEGFLRKGTNKVKAILYDISDDCSLKTKRNYTLNHFIEELKSTTKKILTMK